MIASMGFRHKLALLSTATVVGALASSAMLATGCGSAEEAERIQRSGQVLQPPTRTALDCILRWNQSFNRYEEPDLPWAEAAFLAFGPSELEPGGCRAYVVVPDVDRLDSSGGGYLFLTSASSRQRRFSSKPELSGAIREVIPPGLSWNATLDLTNFDRDWTAQAVERGTPRLAAKTLSECIDAWNSPRAETWIESTGNELVDGDGEKAQVSLDPLVPYSCEMIILRQGSPKDTLLYFRSPSSEWNTTTVDPKWALIKKSKTGTSTLESLKWNGVVGASKLFLPSSDLIEAEAAELVLPDYGIEAEPVVNRFRSEFTDCGAILISKNEPQAGITNIRKARISCKQVVEELKSWMRFYYGSIVDPEGWTCREFEDPTGSGRDKFCRRGNQVISFFQST